MFCIVLADMEAPLFIYWCGLYPMKALFRENAQYFWVPHQRSWHLTITPLGRGLEGGVCFTSNSSENESPAEIESSVWD